jgi:hypothetical protein
VRNDDLDRDRRGGNARERDRGARPPAAALVGGSVAVVAGVLANDSPPDMLAIGAVMLLLAVAYARSGPLSFPSREPSEDATLEALTRA